MLSGLAGITLQKTINFNIRCFEMAIARFVASVASKINFNIRCFEIAAERVRYRQQGDKLQHKMF